MSFFSEGKAEGAEGKDAPTASVSPTWVLPGTRLQYLCC